MLLWDAKSCFEAEISFRKADEENSISFWARHKDKSPLEKDNETNPINRLITGRPLAKLLLPQRKIVQEKSGREKEGGFYAQREPQGKDNGVITIIYDVSVRTVFTSVGH